MSRGVIPQNCSKIEDFDSSCPLQRGLFGGLRALCSSFGNVESDFTSMRSPGGTTGQGLVCQREPWGGRRVEPCRGGLVWCCEQVASIKGQMIVRVGFLDRCPRPVRSGLCFDTPGTSGAALCPGGVIPQNCSKIEDFDSSCPLQRGLFGDDCRVGFLDSLPPARAFSVVLRHAGNVWCGAVSRWCHPPEL